MMLIVESNKDVNRMSLSALAACMAPLLLRPLLLGECEVEGGNNMAGDGSMQLLQAAAAANHAQAIVSILLEHYEWIFDGDYSEEGSFASDAYTESEYDDNDENDENCIEGSTDNDATDDHDYNDHTDNEGDIDDSGTGTDNGSDIGSNLPNNKVHKKHDSESASDADHKTSQNVAGNTSAKQAPSKDKERPAPTKSKKDAGIAKTEGAPQKGGTEALLPISESSEFTGNEVANGVPSKTSRPKVYGSAQSMKSWGRTSARRNLSNEDINCPLDDEIAVQRLENTKNDLQAKLEKEAKENTILKESVERRKKVIQERHIELQNEVEKLREQLQKERNLRSSLESGLMNMRRGQVPLPSEIDEKTKADLKEIAVAEADVVKLKHKAADMRGQLGELLLERNASLCELCGKQLNNKDQPAEKGKHDSDSSVLQKKEDPSILDGGLKEPVKQSLLSLYSRNKRHQHHRREHSASKSPKSGSAGSNHENNGLNKQAASAETETLPHQASLASLTNRIKLLKERNAQLASELKGINVTNALPPAGPPPDTSSNASSGAPGLSSDTSSTVSSGAPGPSSSDTSSTASSAAPPPVTNSSQTPPAGAGTGSSQALPPGKEPK